METPIKKSKIGFHSDIKTAETPNLQMSSTKPTIADVEAEELFENFSRIVTISESNEEFEAEPIYKMLEYERENKLNFDMSTNSMKKKRRGSRLMQEGECIKVKAFDLDQHSQGNKEGIEEEVSPEMKRRISKSGVMSTPTKKPVRTVDLELAARKENPFRDLESKRNLFG